MKQVLSLDIALIEMNGEAMVLRHPSTIFTDDDVPVILFETEEQLNYHLARLSPEAVPPLPSEGWIEKDKVYSYEGKLLKCIQGHNRTIFSPFDTPALFNVIEPVSGEDYPVWKQPAGAHDAYKKGDIVWYPAKNTDLYESLIDGNVWSPAANPAGWRQVGGEPEIPEEPSIKEWQTGVAYKINDMVTYQGSTYRCVQAHTSQAGWTPAAVPSLWQRQ